MVWKAVRRWWLGHDPLPAHVQLGVDIQNGLRPVDDVLQVPEVARMLWLTRMRRRGHH